MKLGSSFFFPPVINKKEETMGDLGNKSNRLKFKNYFDRFNKLPVYSYTKPNDKKVYLGCKPIDVYSLFNGNTSTEKKTISKEHNLPNPDELTIDQSAPQFYMILALQDFYCNYYVPLIDENRTLKEQLSLIKKKNDDRFDAMTKNLEILARHVNELKKKIIFR